jgi:hypothetical protein
MKTLNYELWDLETGNCLGAFGSEAAALAEVRAGVREDGSAAWESVGLLWAGERPGDARRIAAGDELIARAQAMPEASGTPAAVPEQPAALLATVQALSETAASLHALMHASSAIPTSSASEAVRSTLSARNALEDAIAAVSAGVILGTTGSVLAIQALEEALTQIADHSTSGPIDYPARASGGLRVKIQTIENVIQIEIMPRTTDDIPTPDHRAAS